MNAACEQFDVAIVGLGPTMSRCTSSAAGPPATWIARCPPGSSRWRIPEGTFFAWLRSSGGRSGSVAIVRPDKFVFALVPAREVGAATREVARQLHRTAASAVHEAPQPLEPSMKEAA